MLLAQHATPYRQDRAMHLSRLCMLTLVVERLCQVVHRAGGMRMLLAQHATPHRQPATYPAASVC